jgi:hypothetical protein
VKFSSHPILVCLYKENPGFSRYVAGCRAKRVRIFLSKLEHGDQARLADIRKLNAAIIIKHMETGFEPTAVIRLFRYDQV